MKVLEIQARGRITIGAVVKVRSSGKQECSLLEWLSDPEQMYRTHAGRLLSLFELASKEGLEALSPDQFHMIDSAERIFEFVAGALRAPCFKASSGQVVICTHLFVKKTQKVPPQEVKVAVGWKSKYEKEKPEWIKELR